MTPQDKKKIRADFCIEIDFIKSSENPSRVFRSMSDLIEAFQGVDQTLVRSIDVQIETALMLEDIETGSLKTWLVNALKAVNDDALKNIDWKPLVGQYLVKAKYIILNKIEGKTSITNRNDIIEIQRELLEFAEHTNVRQIPAYNPVTQKEIITCIEKITTALEPLSNQDKATYVTPDARVPFNLDMHISPEEIEDLITREQIETACVMIMKVKKPDYLGESKWEFIFDNHIIHVKIVDVAWLEDFQKRKLDVRPGDSIKAKVLVRTKYDYDFDVIGIYYDALEIIEILKPDNSSQLTF